MKKTITIWVTIVKDIFYSLFAIENLICIYEHKIIFSNLLRRCHNFKSFNLYFILTLVNESLSLFSCVI